MSSLDTIARRQTGVTYETLVRRILATFDRATPTDLEAGARWYDAARELATTLALESGRTVEQTAGVIAHLSPRQSWTRNVVGAVTLIRESRRAPGIMSREYGRATLALTAVDVESTFGGPKTLRFWRNICGDVESVTVDVWAARVAGVTQEQLARVGTYDALESAYRAAARRRGVDPVTMQATTWIVARNGRAS